MDKTTSSSIISSASTMATTLWGSSSGSGGWHLTTTTTQHRGDQQQHLGGGSDDAVVYFQYECFLAACAIFFFRTTIHSSNCESPLLRYFFAILLAGLAYNKKSYELILAVEVFSYVVPRLLPTITTTTTTNTKKASSSSSTTTEDSSTSSTSSTKRQETLLTLLRIAGSAVASLLASHLVVTGTLHRIVMDWILIPSNVMQLLYYLFPIRELHRAYDIMHQFAEGGDSSSSSSPAGGVLAKQVHHLLFVTFHIQVGIGYLGIHFLRQEQHRRNQLIRMDMDNIDMDNETTTTSTTKDDVNNVTTSSSSAKDNDNDTTTTTDPRNGANSNTSSKASSTGANGTSSKRIQRSSAQQQKHHEAKNDITQNNNTQQHHPKTTTTTAATATSDEQRRLEQRLQKSRRFQSTAAPFIFFTAIPYMTKIIIMGNVNQFAMTCFQHDLHRIVRLNQLFAHSSHLVAMSTQTATSPEAYANSMSTVVDTAYSLFNRKLFSLPKVMLLPSVMARQPMLLVQIFPFIFASDYIKAWAESYMTTWVEDLQKEIKELSSIQGRIESFDMKNAELLTRSGKGATQYTQRRWQSLVVQIQERVVLSDLITRTKLYFSWIQRNFVFSVLVDCALANLMAIGKLVAADIFVFSRAIEDTVDLILMRSRSEAELARMDTEIEKLSQLVDIWKRSEKRSLVHCSLPPPLPHPHYSPLSSSSSSSGGGDNNQQRRNLVLRNLHYSRGTASVRADHVELKPGAYALTGPNGSGKSTLFRVLMSCHTNEKPIDLPPSINLLTPMAPLIEKDDLIRETSCEVDYDPDDEDENNNEQQCEADYSSSSSSSSNSKDGVVADGEKGQDSARSLSPREQIDPMRLDHVPKLSVTMPSTRVIEISQTFYWPLYSRPIDWIYQENVLDSCEASEVQARIRKVAEELYALDFFQPVQLQPQQNKNNISVSGDDDEASEPQSPEELEEAAIVQIMKELQEEKEDWFSDLSGGQKSKVELVRLVFIQDECPDVLLVDETMAPLDPASKSLVMKKLKEFCSQSIIIVIYHTDVQQQTTPSNNESGGGVSGGEECVPSTDFFDQNLHVEHGLLHIRPTC